MQFLGLVWSHNGCKSGAILCCGLLQSYDGMIHNGLMGNMDDDVHCSGNQEDRNEEIRPEVSRISCKNRLRQFRTWVKGKCNYKPRTGFACYTPTIDNATKFGGVKDGEEKEEHGKFLILRSFENFYRDSFVA